MITSNRSRLHTIYEFTDSINGVSQIEEKDLIDENLEMPIDVHILDKDSMPKPIRGIELSKYNFGTTIFVSATNRDSSTLQYIDVALKSGCLTYVDGSQGLRWLDDDDDDDRFDSCQIMLNKFRYIVNEFIDMSRGQVYYEDIINKFKEMGFEIY